MGKVRVMVVSKQAQMCQQLRSAMTTWGYAFHEVNDGEEALMHLRRVKPNLILLHPDATSDMNRLLRRLTPFNIPVVVCWVDHAEKEALP